MFLDASLGPYLEIGVVVNGSKAGLSCRYPLQVLNHDNLNVTEDSHWKLDVGLGMFAAEIVMAFNEKGELGMEILSEGPNGAYQGVHIADTLEKTLEEDSITLKGNSNMVEVPGESQSSLSP
jgi:hypothetical protein